MPIDRRNLLVLGASAAIARNVVEGARVMAEEPVSNVRFGLVTDMHYADKPSAGTRHYRDALKKLEEAATEFDRANPKPSFVVELGDFIDAADSVETESRYLKTIDRTFRTVASERHYVLGNHCVDTLTSDEFLAAVGQRSSYYAFGHGGRRFIVLDACYRKDGVHYGRKNFDWSESFIPEHETAFLESELRNGHDEVVVFVHQRLDVDPPYGIVNAGRVRALLERSSRVKAVFQGHSHKNDYRQIGGIHYVTLVAMVEGEGPENSGYAVADWLTDGTLVVEGFRRQKGYRWMT